MKLCLRNTVVAILCLAVLLVSGSLEAAPLDYSQQSNWVYAGQDSGNHKVDVFFVAPTVYLGGDKLFNMPMDDRQLRQNFRGATNMEKGLYDRQANFYAPYYRQAALTAYSLDPAAARPYFDAAYEDVKAAFVYYLKNHNKGRPVVLAGFSQGSDMILRLMKDMYKSRKLRDQLVGAYAIGWRVTPEELKQYRHLKMAQGETDTGVIVSFNTEAPDVKASVIVPHRTLGINPLNWKTTGEMAPASLNKGAVFTDYAGEIRQEIPHMTGAYLDPARGTLKVTDVDSDQYPPIIDLFADGVYHVYDYMFFYRNLQDNVTSRIQAYWKKQEQ